jgi:hypothetical protein
VSEIKNAPWVRRERIDVRRHDLDIASTSLTLSMWTVSSTQCMEAMAVSYGRRAFAIFLGDCSAQASSSVIVMS